MPPEPLPFAPERPAGSHLPEGAPTRAWRRLDRLVLAATMVGLLVPWTLLLAGLRPRPIENRPLATLPAVSVNGLLDGSWFRGADAFVADNVFVRPYAIRVRGEAYWLSGGTGNPQVVRGQPGWLFTRDEFEPTCHSTADQVVAGLQAAMTGVGPKVTVRFVAIPDKHDIYADEVGADPFPSSCADTNRADLRAGLATLGPAGIDGWSILEAARAGQPNALLYYRQDTHWTPVGAIQVVRALVQSIDPAAWSDSDIVVNGLKSRTDELAAQMGLRRTEMTSRVTVRPSTTVRKVDVPVSVPLHNAPSVFRTTATGPEPVVTGRTLILYDSFFGIDVPLVAPFFQDATWVHVGDMTASPELAAELGPFDTVVVERVEREIYVLDVGKLFSRLTG